MDHEVETPQPWPCQPPWVVKSLVQVTCPLGSKVTHVRHLPVLSPSPGNMAQAPTVLVESGCRGVPGM